MKKIVSLLTAAVIAISCLGMSSNAFAADAKNTVTVTVSGTQYNNIVQDAISDLNAARNAGGYSDIVLDDTLTKIAQKRAAEAILYFDVDSNGNELLPDGNRASTYFSDGGIGEFTAQTVAATASVDSVFDFISALASDDTLAKTYNSIGLAVFKRADTVAIYAVISLNKSSTPYTVNTAADYKLNVSLLIKNIYAAETEFIRSKNGKYYTFETSIVCMSLNGDIFKLANSQLTYSSTKPAILKIKDNRGFSKKKGKAVVVAKNKSGTVVAKTEATITVSAVKIVISKANSPKKKKLYVKWQKNVSNANGYQIQYSTDKKFKKGVKTVTVKGKNNISKTIGKLKSGKTYYVRVRAYADQGFGEKLFAPWGKAKAVKVK